MLRLVGLLGYFGVVEKDLVTNENEIKLRLVVWPPLKLRSSSHAHCILSGLEIYSIDMQFLYEALSFRLSPRSLSTVEQLLHPASCFRLQQDYKANCYINSRERGDGLPHIP
ncbi:uncharacterized protein LOC119296013 isoform X2 [Triticum dicoccoides]|uniref:uncharacterized protein LOC119296013 isoform X2 n=1 Tax=Triticum dicoccoides TaxID=85692 RepID=UPI000E7C6BE8|nr:uncharacterized protein LOC119296013 isoform X2 [Triticum dicoccoides]XP_037430331.1 uncharacterized protein LOC119296013 isoform X2 [Triticum dicoccoides]XP_044369525.1 uncharacterized protein LOC123091958 isoform X2 [Triticum aestivum]XP_044369526.1 uncharacterized protein LOC123091958 isoform X2 [Triticum aestivum]